MHKHKTGMLLLCLLFITLLSFPMSVQALGEGSNRVTYTYDDLNRLIKVQYLNGSVINYSYDAAGNILSITETAGFTYGDVNSDSSVNVTDAVLVLKYITNLETIIDTGAADVNGDNAVNITDAVLILKHITNPEIPFPAE